MQVIGLWRHPVKSLGGEALTGADLDADGLRGDRGWGIQDEQTGRILTGRREPRLLEASSSLGPDGEPVIELATGPPLHGPGAATDAALSAWLGRPVRLVSAADEPAGRAEFFADPTDDDSAAVEWTMPGGRFVDALPILVLTTASLRAAAALHPVGAWDPRRFRPNVLVDAEGSSWLEDGWEGRRVHLGAASILPRQACVRCTMVTRPQPGLDRDLDIYRTLARHHGGTFGAWSTVDQPGRLAIGDDVTVD